MNESGGSQRSHKHMDFPISLKEVKAVIRAREIAQQHRACLESVRF